jgi:hypothetical protein
VTSRTESHKLRTPLEIARQIAAGPKFREEKLASRDRVATLNNNNDSANRTALGKISF